MKIILTLIFSLISLSGWAQFGFALKQQLDVKTIIGTDTLEQPWVGGLNAPQFSKIDLNQDGTEDLYIFDRMLNKSFTFLAENKNGAWKWKYAPEYEALFPQNLTLWVLLADFNGDGRKDLFTQHEEYIYCYRNTSPMTGPVRFGPGRKIRITTGLDLELSDYLLPALTDVDNDGDLDILIFDNNSAENIEFYKNLSKETYNHTDSLHFINATGRWGRFSRCSPACNSFVSGVTCRVAKTMHGGGGSILALDLDGDNDKDLLIGSDMCPDVARVTNIGSVALANTDSNSFSYNFPTNSVKASVPNFPAAFYEDVTFDGKKDLLVAPFLFDNADKVNLIRSSWLYENTAISGANSPVFTFQKNNFLQGKMLDLGESANPVFVDIDADGDQDLLIGNYASLQNGGFKSTVSLFMNLGTVNNPIFKLTDPDYLQFSTADYKGIKLQFADMDGNGSLDLILKFIPSGGSLSYLAFIPNSAQAGQPLIFSRANQTAVAITINENDRPYFYDLDGDGDLDLLLGTEMKSNSNPNNGAIWYFKRVGANASSFSSWQLINTHVGNILQGTGRENIQPFVADFNNDGRPDLLTSDNSGAVRIFPDILSNLFGTLSAQQNLLFNPFQNRYLPTALGTVKIGGTRNNLHLAAADLDGDQKPEMVIGTIGGGLVYFKNESTILGISQEQIPLACSIYPNPANEWLQVTGNEPTALCLYDSAGKLLRQITNSQQTHHIDIGNLKQGLYYLKIVGAGNRSAGKAFVISR